MNMSADDLLRAVVERFRSAWNVHTALGIICKEVQNASAQLHREDIETLFRMLLETDSLKRVTEGLDIQALRAVYLEAFHELPDFCKTKATIDDVLLRSTDIVDAAPVALQGVRLPRKTELLERYELREQLGEGAFGKVFRAVHLDVRKEFAIKVIRKGNFETIEQYTHLRHEVEAAAKLSHPHIVAPHEVSLPDLHSGMSIDVLNGLLSSTSMFVVYKLIEDAKPIDEYVRAKRLPLPRLQELLHHVVDAVAYAHREGVFHHDIKSSNILVDKQGTPHLIDFGLSQRVGAPDPYPGSGSYTYRAPERQMGHDDTVGEADVWSLGVLIFLLLTGKKPFSEEQARDDSVEVPTIPPLDDGTSDGLIRLCNRCLARNVSERITIAELAQRISVGVYHSSLMQTLKAMDADPRSDSKRAFVDYVDPISGKWERHSYDEFLLKLKSSPQSDTNLYSLAGFAPPRVDASIFELFRLADERQFLPIWLSAEQLSAAESLRALLFERLGSAFDADSEGPRLLLFADLNEIPEVDHERLLQRLQMHHTSNDSQAVAPVIVVVVDRETQSVQRYCRKSYYAALPNEPFHGLRRYGFAQRHLFFGRDRLCNDVVELVTGPTSEPVCLLTGQSGSGKSSCLATKIVPGIRGKGWDVVHCRLSGTEPMRSVKEALGFERHVQLTDCGKIRHGPNHRVVLVIDQAEDVFVDHRGDKGEWNSNNSRFLDEIGVALRDQAGRLRVLICLRSEVSDSAETRLGELPVRFSKKHLTSLNMEDVKEILTSLSKSTELKRRYRISIGQCFIHKVCSHLQFDVASPVAPTLQLILSKMWELCSDDFTGEQFEKTVRENRLFSNYIQAELTELGASLFERLHSSHQVDADQLSALALNVVAHHVEVSAQQRYLTSRTIDSNQLRKDYPNVIPLESIVEGLKRKHLLTSCESPSQSVGIGKAVGRDATRLTHEAIAYTVWKLQSESFTTLGESQQVLGISVVAWKRHRRFLDPQHFELLAHQSLWMRGWTDEEQVVFDCSHLVTPETPLRDRLMAVSRIAARLVARLKKNEVDYDEVLSDFAERTVETLGSSVHLLPFEEIDALCSAAFALTSDDAKFEQACLSVALLRSRSIEAFTVLSKHVNGMDWQTREEWLEVGQRHGLISRYIAERCLTENVTKASRVTPIVSERLPQIRELPDAIELQCPEFQRIREERFSHGTLRIYIHYRLGPEEEFVLIPGGEFWLGSELRQREQPVHLQSVPPFLMSRTPITQRAWENTLGDLPEGLKAERKFQGDSKPVVSVNWEECLDFCKNVNLDLPQECEWEYAAKGGVICEWPSGGYYDPARDGDEWPAGHETTCLTDYAWFSLNSGNQTQPVGMKLPNGFGLFDTCGNVWEFCREMMVGYMGTDNPDIKKGCRVMRGGCFNSPVNLVRTSLRNGVPTTDKEPRGRNVLGFRVVRRLEQ